jgi:hypothetical protein
MTRDVVGFPRTAPPHVARFARALGLTTDQLRWCACGLVAYAADDYQRRALDRAGFTDRCPECAARTRKRVAR